jgi:hypothetical protein
MSVIYINPYAFAAPWTPANITTALWVDANDSSTITESGGVVSQWDDKSGNARHLAQAFSFQNPTYDATGFNSLPTIKGLASSFQRLRTTGNVSGFSGGSSLWGIAVGTMESGTSTNGRLFSFGAVGLDDWNAVPRTLLIGRRIATNSLEAFRNSSSLSTANISLDTPSIFGSVFNGTNHIFYLDGTAASAVSSTGNFTSTPQLTIFNDSTNAGWTGKCSEFILGDTTLSSADRERIEGYLAHKWALTGNLPGGHPYKTAAPTA